MDIYLEGPAIIRKGHRLSSLPLEKRVPCILHMIQDCISLDNKMQNFLQELEASEGSPLYWAGPPKLLTMANEQDFSFGDEKLFGCSYEFLDARVCSTLLLSWAGLTILLSGACQLYGALGHLTTLTPAMNGKLQGSFSIDGQIQTFQIPPLDRFSEFSAMARNVCLSIEFGMRDDLNLPTIIAPLNMCIDAWTSWPNRFDEEIAWARKMLLYIHDRGLKISKYTPRT
jgi:hypothetical protein